MFGHIGNTLGGAGHGWRGPGEATGQGFAANKELCIVPGLGSPALSDSGPCKGTQSRSLGQEHLLTLIILEKPVVRTESPQVATA